jgi:hypothetical protein
MRGIEFQRAEGGAQVVPPLQGGENCFGDTVTQGFTLGYHMTGFQPSAIAALQGRNVKARPEGPVKGTSQIPKPCKGDTTQTRLTLDAESAEVLENIKALLK